MAFGVTDEIFGISSIQKNPLRPSFMYGAMSVAIPGWVLGTWVGAMAGSILASSHKLLASLGVLSSCFVPLIIKIA